MTDIKDWNGFHKLLLKRKWYELGMSRWYTVQCRYKFRNLLPLTRVTLWHGNQRCLFRSEFFFTVIDIWWLIFVWRESSIWFLYVTIIVINNRNVPQCKTYTLLLCVKQILLIFCFVVEKLISFCRRIRSTRKRIISLPLVRDTIILLRDKRISPQRRNNCYHFSAVNNLVHNNENNNENVQRLT